MRWIDSLTDQMNGVVTYELPDGDRVQLDARAVQMVGAERLLRDIGLKPWPDDEPEWVPLMQNGVKVGMLPRGFDPMFAQSHSLFYDIRPGDFTREGDVWIAHRSLGPGDIEAVAGFAEWRRP